ncbi:MAG: histidine phosphatase family protein, partial [Thermoleophilia bacterium]
MIYLLRHGEAEEGVGDDAARRLTPKGERQARAAGEALAALASAVDACLTSPKV